MKPKVLVKGNPDCVHHEKIENNIGVCIKCGRKIQYVTYYQLTESKFNPQRGKTPTYLEEMKNRRGNIVTR